MNFAASEAWLRAARFYAEERLKAIGLRIETAPPVFMAWALGEPYRVTMRPRISVSSAGTYAFTDNISGQ